jgi:hypothetical protein
MDTVDDLYPVFDLLENRLTQGCYIVKQGDYWWLFDAGGEGLCHGETIRQLLVNLILMEC